MNGMVLLRYVGGNVGLMHWRGEVTGTRYEFGGKKVTGYVYAKDAPAMLEKRKNRQRLFRRAPVPVVAPIEPVAPESETGSLKATGLDALALSDLYQLSPEDLTVVHGVGQATADRLIAVGIETVAALAEAESDGLVDEMPGFAPWRAQRIIEAAQEMTAGG